MLGEDGHIVVEIDVHGAPTPQILGAVMGAAALHSSGRTIALDTIGQVVAGRWGGLAPDVEIRTVAEAMWNGYRPRSRRRASGSPADRPRSCCGAGSVPTSAGRWKCWACGQVWTSSATT